jgi:hypothetical protein
MQGNWLLDRNVNHSDVKSQVWPSWSQGQGHVESLELYEVKKFVSALYLWTDKRILIFFCINVTYNEMMWRMRPKIKHSQPRGHLICIDLCIGKTICYSAKLIAQVPDVIYLTCSFALLTSTKSIIIMTLWSILVHTRGSRDWFRLIMENIGIFKSSCVRLQCKISCFCGHSQHWCL